MPIQSFKRYGEKDHYLDRRDVNARADVLEALMRSSLPGVTGQDGFQAKRGGRVAPVFEMFVLHQVFDDYLSCALWQPGTYSLNDSGPLFNIAKAPNLQVNFYKGETVTGPTGTLTYSFSGSGATQTMTTTKSTDGSTETHVVAPFWGIADPNATPAPFPGDIIHAIYWCWKANPWVVDDKNQAVVWQDLNLAGRVWSVQTTS